MPDTRFSYYRNSNGNEIDLIFEHKHKRFAIECKASTTPKVQKGFSVALQTIEADEAWIVAPVKEPYPYNKTTMVGSPIHILQHLEQI